MGVWIKNHTVNSYFRRSYHQCQGFFTGVGWSQPGGEDYTKTLQFPETFDVFFTSPGFLILHTGCIMKAVGYKTYLHMTLKET